MTLGGIFLSSFIIGFSGAIMPGPMLGVTVDGSLKKGFKAGPLVVAGHAILEIALILVMAFGLRKFFENPVVAGVIGVFGGVFLGWMGIDMIKSSIKKTISLEKQKGSRGKGGNLVLLGIIVSATNPYFIMWWASTGAESIRLAYAFGIAGICLFFTGHILSDFVWFSAISIAFSTGKRLINDRVYRWITLFLGLFILTFSLYFIRNGWQILLSR